MMIPALASNSTLFLREIKPLTPLYSQRPSLVLKNSVDVSSKQIKTEPLTSRPTLLPPSNLRLTKFVCELEKTEQSMVENLSERLSDISNEGAEQSRAYQKELKENADKIKDGLAWSVLKKVWTAFFSAVTALFGFSNIIAGNVFVGAALIASGILSLTNLLCSELGVWDEVAKKLAQEDQARQKQIAFCIPLTLSILTAGLALFGGIYDLTHSKEFLSNQFFFALLASCSILEGVVNIGQGVTQMRTLHSQAGLLKMQATLESTNIETKMCADALGNFFSSMQKIFERLSRVMQINAQTNLAILQG
jgi:hypothetical protein